MEIILFLMKCEKYIKGMINFNLLKEELFMNDKKINLLDNWNKNIIFYISKDNSLIKINNLPIG